VAPRSRLTCPTHQSGYGHVTFLTAGVCESHPPAFPPHWGPARHGLPRRHATACCASPVALLISGQIRARFRGAAAAIPGHATAHVVGARRRRSPAGPPVQQGCCVHGPCGFALSRTENVNVGFVCLRGGVPRRPTQKPPPLHTRLGPVYAPGVCLEHSGPCWAGRRTRRATVTGWCHPAPLCPPPGCCALCCIPAVIAGAGRTGRQTGASSFWLHTPGRFRGVAASQTPRGRRSGRATSPPPVARLNAGGAASVACAWPRQAAVRLRCCVGTHCLGGVGPARVCVFASVPSTGVPRAVGFNSPTAAHLPVSCASRAV